MRKVSCKGLSRYLQLKMVIELILEQNQNDHELIRSAGKGFLFVFEQYGTSSIVLEYFAEQYIQDIFGEIVDLEKYLHENYPHFNDQGTNQTTTFLMTFIGTRDVALANYLATNPHLLQDKIKKINKIKENWENFEQHTMEKKVDIIYDETLRVLEKYNLQHELSYTEVVFYLLKKVGKLEKIKQYDERLADLDRKYDEEKTEQDYYSMTFESKQVDLIQKKALKEIREKILKLINSRTIDDTPNDYDEPPIKQQFNTTIINFQEMTSTGRGPRK